MEVLVAVLIVLGVLTLSGERAGPQARPPSVVNLAVTDARAADAPALAPCTDHRVRDLTRPSDEVRGSEATERAAHGGAGGDG